MRSRALLGATLVVALVGACGGDDDESSRGVEVADLEQTAAVTKDAGRARIAIEVESEGDDPFVFTGEGLVDVAADEFQLVFSGEDPESGESIDAEVRKLGTDVWVRVPDQEREDLGVETEWVHGTTDDADVESLLGDAFADPQATLDGLEGLGNAERVGREALRGADTTHFHAELGVEDLASAEGDEEGTGLGILLLFTGGEPLPIDIWVDDDNRLRKIRIEFDLSGIASAFAELDTDDGAQAEESLGRFVIQLEFYDFGTDDEIEPPPAAQVSEAPDDFPWDDVGNVDEGDEISFEDDDADLDDDSSFEFSCVDLVSDAIDAYQEEHGDDAQPTPDDLVDAGLLESADGVTIEWGEFGPAIVTMGGCDEE